MLSIMERGLEPGLWPGTDRWSLLQGVWKRLVCPGVPHACLLPGAFFNGLCSIYSIGMDWNTSVVRRGQHGPAGLFHKLCVTWLQDQVSCSNRKIFDLPGRQRVMVFWNWPITFDRQSWWCFTFINLVCCEHSKKMEISILTIITQTDNQRVAGTADRPASQRPLVTEASGLCQLTELATALCSQIMGIIWETLPLLVKQFHFNAKSVMAKTGH